MSAKVDNPDGSLPLKGRQETFCQIYADGKVSVSQAYQQAGYSKVEAHSAGHRLYVKVGIQARIDHIKAQRAKDANITREGQAEKFDRALRMATEQGNAAGMVAAITGTNRLYGLDKQVIETHADEPMSRSEQEEADDWAEFKLWRAGQGGPRVVSIQGGA